MQKNSTISSWPNKLSNFQLFTSVYKKITENTSKTPLDDKNNEVKTLINDNFLKKVEINLKKPSAFNNIKNNDYFAIRAENIDKRKQSENNGKESNSKKHLTNAYTINLEKSPFEVSAGDSKILYKSTSHRHHQQILCFSNCPSPAKRKTE